MKQPYKLKYNGTGEHLTNFIRDMYYLLAIDYETCKKTLCSSLSLRKNTTEQTKDTLCKTILLGQYKCIGTDSIQLVCDDNFDIYNHTIFSKPKHFDMDKGVNGILLNNGIFVECDENNHDSIICFVTDWNNKLLSGAIKFVINNNQDLSYCESNTIPTEPQMEWFKNNMQYLDKNQKELFMQKTKIAIERISTMIKKMY